MLLPVPKVLALDAMGVIYWIGDDVADVLIPFIYEKGGTAERDEIEAAYNEASLGNIDAIEFWRRVGVSPDLEDEYLARLELSEGVIQFLQAALRQFERIVCLSNDLSAWSRKLRQRFGLEQHITGWYISGDIGHRKPASEIYRHMLQDLVVAPSQVVFVDDRIKNLSAANELGIQTIYFDPTRLGNADGHRTVSTLATLLEK
jgi:HAD superfamily hydrolase (TIGR01509 family)